MRTPTLGLLALGIVGLTALVLTGVGAPSGRKPPDAVATSSPPGPATVSARGISLTSTSIDLPPDDQSYPAGPHVEIVNANCASCHSPDMALNQPALSADQWKAEVTKMREVYQAPILTSNVPAILTYLVTMSGQRSATFTGKGRRLDFKAQSGSADPAKRSLTVPVLIHAFTNASAPEVTNSTHTPSSGPLS